MDEGWYGDGMDIEDEFDEVDVVEDDDPVRVILMAVGRGCGGMLEVDEVKK